jgi:hypothetical protein
MIRKPKNPSVRDIFSKNTVLRLEKKEEGWWLLAVPVRYSGELHEISSIKVSETSTGKRFLVGFDVKTESPVPEVAHSFVISNGNLRTYGIFSDYVSEVLFFLGTLILELEEKYPEEEVDLEEMGESVYLDIPEPKNDRKIWIDRAIDEGGVNYVLQSRVG